MAKIFETNFENYSLNAKVYNIKPIVTTGYQGFSKFIKNNDKVCYWLRGTDLTYNIPLVKANTSFSILYISRLEVFDGDYVNINPSTYGDLNGNDLTTYYTDKQPGYAGVTRYPLDHNKLNFMILFKNINGYKVTNNNPFYFYNGTYYYTNDNTNYAKASNSTNISMGAVVYNGVMIHKVIIYSHLLSDKEVQKEYAKFLSTKTYKKTIYLP